MRRLKDEIQKNADRAQNAARRAAQKAKEQLDRAILEASKIDQVKKALAEKARVSFDWDRDYFLKLGEAVLNKARSIRKRLAKNPPKRRAKVPKAKPVVVSKKRSSLKVRKKETRRPAAIPPLP